MNAPVFCFTNTYQKRKFGRRPRIVTYVDGPFSCDASLPRTEQKKQLRNQVLTAMKRDCKNSNLELIRYIKKEEK
ncbi:MAG: hypothetical protein K6G30_10960, partial [Acetatifactor sp.]|nr:hypothetical protein [Acetatifactor sp.]